MSTAIHILKNAGVYSFAPGRVELLGNHTDYNQGIVLSAALDLGVSAQGHRRNDDQILLYSEGHHDVVRFGKLTFIEPGRNWADYPLGVVKVLSLAGYAVGGFEARFSSTLPAGAGLASSAAMEVATAALLRQIFHLDIAPLEAARFCRKAENEFVGVNCGLLDQVSSALGRREHAILLDCRTESIAHIPFPAGVGLLVVHSGVKHSLVGGEYNERRQACFEAAAKMGVVALRDVTAADVAASDLPDLLRRRALHITGENERVFQAAEFLRNGNVAGFGKLMFDSHQSSRTNFENSTPELDALVEIAANTDGVYGARLTGGGFGGAIVALVDLQSMNAAAGSVLSHFQKLTFHTATAFQCTIGDGTFPQA